MRYEAHNYTYLLEYWSVFLYIAVQADFCEEKMSLNFQIEISNIDNPQPDTISVRSAGSYDVTTGQYDVTAGSYGNDDVSEGGTMPSGSKKQKRRRSSIADPNEKYFCRFCDQEMPNRKEKIKHQVCHLVKSSVMSHRENDFVIFDQNESLWKNPSWIMPQSYEVILFD